MTTRLVDCIFGGIAGANGLKKKLDAPRPIGNLNGKPVYHDSTEGRTFKVNDWTESFARNESKSNSRSNITSLEYNQDNLQELVLQIPNHLNEVQNVKSEPKITAKNLPEKIQEILEAFYKKKMPEEEDVTVEIPHLQSQVPLPKPGTWVRWSDLDENQRKEIVHLNQRGDDTRIFRSFKGPSFCKDLVPRWIHGCMHASRVAMEVGMLATLYNKYNPDLKLSEEDVLIAQYLASFHDSQRQAEGVDIWDDASAEAARSFLKSMGFNEAKVNEYVEAIRTKDAPHENKHIMAKLIHDADSLDILRLFLKEPAKYKIEMLDSFQDFKDKEGFVDELNSFKNELINFIQKTETTEMKLSLEQNSKSYYGDILSLACITKDEQPLFPKMRQLIEPYIGEPKKPTKALKALFNGENQLTNKEMNREQVKEWLDKKTSNKIPLFDEIFEIIDPTNLEVVDTKRLDDTLQKLHTSRLVSKGELSYALLEAQAKKLVQARSDELKFNQNMQKLGFSPVTVTVKSEGGELSKVHVMQKENTSFLVHTTNFSLINQKVRSKMLTEERKDDPEYLMNNNDKLCVSIVNTDSGSMFQHESRGGLILAVPPSNILDTYPLDRISPTGFRRPQSEINKLSEEELQKYNTNLKNMNDFITFLKKYRAITLYVDSLYTTIINSLLQYNPLLSEAQKISLITKLAHLSERDHKLLSHHNTPELEEMSSLQMRLEDLMEIYRNYGGEMLDTLNFGSRIFDTSTSSKASVNILEQLQIINKNVNEIFSNDKALQINLNSNAANWDKDIQRGVHILKRLIPERIYGPNEILVHAKDKSFNELNIKPERDMEIAGYAIHISHFSVDEQGNYFIDKDKVIKVNNSIIKPLEQKIMELEAKSKAIRSAINGIPLDSSNQTLYEENDQIQTELNIKKELLSFYKPWKIEKEMIDLIEFSEKSHIPVVLIGQQPRRNTSLENCSSTFKNEFKEAINKERETQLYSKKTMKLSQLEKKFKKILEQRVLTIDPETQEIQINENMNARHKSKLSKLILASHAYVLEMSPTDVALNVLSKLESQIM